MVQNRLLLSFFIFTLWLPWTCNAQTEVCLRVPRTVDDCYARSKNYSITPKSAKVDCLQRLLWHYQTDQGLSSRSMSYFAELSSTWTYPVPKTGFRIRKEYRMLTRDQRERLHGAFNTLYEKGTIQKYADLHANALQTAHTGAAFLAWHRVFLAYFEEELRHVDATVSIPYWDSSLDFDMDNGVNSVLWSAELLGNGNGDVITGPFAGWMTGRGILSRMYGDRGRLISDEKIQLMTSVCLTDEVVFPQVDPDNREERDHIIEYHHNGVHNWVGGDMADGSYAAYDPVFYMHHAFIDFIWEKFRRHQNSTCLINPENAYATRTGGSGHGPNDLMYGFTFFKNVDGLKNVWTEKWYNYEESPQCPNCGSKYLYCNTTTNRCVSHSRRTDFNVGKFMSSPEATTFGMVNELVEPLTNIMPKRIIFPFMPSPNPDGRFHGTAKEDALVAVNIQESPLQPSSSGSAARSFPFNSWVENLEQASGGRLSSRPGRRRRKFISLF